MVEEPVSTTKQTTTETTTTTPIKSLKALTSIGSEEITTADMRTSAEDVTSTTEPNSEIPLEPKTDQEAKQDQKFLDLHFPEIDTNSLHFKSDQQITLDENKIDMSIQETTETTTTTEATTITTTEATSTTATTATTVTATEIPITTTTTTDPSVFSVSFPSETLIRDEAAKVENETEMTESTRQPDPIVPFEFLSTITGMGLGLVPVSSTEAILKPTKTTGFTKTTTPYDWHHIFSEEYQKGNFKIPKMFFKRFYCGKNPM
jgi:hypothetical protein